MTYINIMREKANNNKKYVVMNCKDDFNNNRTDYRQYIDYVDLLEQAVYNDNSVESINAVIIQICKVLGCNATDFDVNNIRKTVSKNAIRSRQTMTDDSKEIAKQYSENIKALESAIHNNKPFNYDNKVYNTCSTRNELLEKLTNERKEFIKGADYNKSELIAVSSTTFRRTLELALVGVKASQYESKLDKELARLSRRLESGKITPDQHKEYVEKAKARFNI